MSATARDKTESPFHLNQEVIHTQRFSSGLRSEPAVIEKVGRRYVYIKMYGRLTAFDKFDGIGKSDGSGYGIGWIRTPEMAVAAERRDAAIQRLSDHGLAKKGYGDIHLRTETIERIVAILDETGEMA